MPAWILHVLCVCCSSPAVVLNILYLLHVCVNIGCSSLLTCYKVHRKLSWHNVFYVFKLRYKFLQDGKSRLGFVRGYLLFSMLIFTYLFGTRGSFFLRKKLCFSPLCIYVVLAYSLAFMAMSFIPKKCVYWTLWYKRTLPVNSLCWIMINRKSKVGTPFSCLERNNFVPYSL